MDIKINTGAKEFNFDGKVSIWINPTDPVFIGKMRETFQDLQKKQDEVKEKLDNAEDIFEVCVQIDAEMREALLKLFGKDIVTPLVGDMNVYALADGMPIWAQILISLMDGIESYVAEENEKASEKIKAYTEKYD